MNLLPVPARVPARKHLLAGAVALLSVGLMLAAVLGTAGLPTPFNSGTSAGVRTSPVDVSGLVPTTTGDASGGGGGVDISDEPTTTSTTRSSTGSTATTQPPTTPTTTTTLVPPTTVPDDPTDGLLGGLGFGRELVQP
jgi:hypothetical protein